MKVQESAEISKVSKIIFFFYGVFQLGYLLSRAKDQTHSKVVHSIEYVTSLRDETSVLA
jgi:hypothetical protein